jgi:hypothetical protein
VATIHTELPKDVKGHHGEYVVGQTLKTYSNPGLELWFDINYLPGVTDLDLIASDNQVGLYLIEIKSVTLDSIETFTTSEFTVKPGAKRQHPTAQLRTGTQNLRKFLTNFPALKAPRGMPFIQCTVLWSEINRSEWKRRFDDPNIAMYEAMCVFKDDLKSYNSFVSALQRLWDRPILGTNPPHHARKEHGAMDAFREAIAPSRNIIKLSKSMTEEISRPVRESKRISEKYGLGKPHKVSIQGAPGTGKTTILREIGLRNLQAGAGVLHVCFNKVLAADQKREYQFLRQKSEEYGFLDVYDVWELYKSLGHIGGIENESNVLENVQNFLASEEGKTFIKYDVILVDESQDLPDSFFKVLELIARPAAAWFIAYGKGQETNNFSTSESHPSPWLSEFLEKSDANHLRRSFRNSTKAFLLAQAFWEKFPELESAKAWLREKSDQQSSSDGQFELDLAVPQNKNDFRIEVLPTNVARKPFIRNIILAALEDSRQANRGEDLLVSVLAPSSKKTEDALEPLPTSYPLVLEVLMEITQEFDLEFHDLVPKESRREIPKVGAIRLVTLQNIRGLSASHVILFDLAQIEKWVDRDSSSLKPPLVNFTYIALSRSKASTIVAIEGIDDSKVEPFLVEMLGYGTELAVKRRD